MYKYRIMQEADGSYTIKYKQSGWIISLFGSNYYYLRHQRGSNKSQEILSFKTLVEAVDHVNEEIRKDKFPIVIREIE